MYGLVALVGMILLGLNWLLSDSLLIQTAGALVFIVGALGTVIQFLRAMWRLVSIAGPVEAQLEVLAEIESRYVLRG